MFQIVSSLGEEREKIEHQLQQVSQQKSGDIVSKQHSIFHPTLQYVLPEILQYCR
jgi:hypothetical protein